MVNRSLVSQTSKLGFWAHIATTVVDADGPRTETTGGPENGGAGWQPLSLLSSAWGVR